MHRPYLPALVAAVALLGVVASWWLLPRLPRDSSLAQLFPRSGDLHRQFEDFDAAFGTDDNLLVVVRDHGRPLVFRPALFEYLDQVTAALEADPGVERVVCLANMQDYTVLSDKLPPLPRPLVPPRRTSLQPEALRARITGDPLLREGLLSADGSAVACWVLLRPGLRSAPDYHARVGAIAGRVPPPPPEVEAWTTGFPLLQAAVHDLFAGDAARLTAVAAAVLVAVGLLGGVPWRAALGFLLVWPAVVGLLAAWAVLTHRPLHVFSHTVPPLLLITSGTSFVHLGLALRRGADGFRSTWYACALATGTTALGFGTLVASGLAPLQALGQDIALGSVVAFLATSAGVRALAAPGGTPRAPRTGRVHRRVPARAWVALAAVLGAPWWLAAGSAGAAQGIVQALPTEHVRAREAAAAQELFGAPTTLEVVVRTDRARVVEPAFWLHLEELEEALRASGGEQVPYVLSPITLLRSLDQRLPGAEAGAGRLRASTVEYAIRHLVAPYLRLLEQDETPRPGSLLAVFADAMRQLLSSSGDRVRFGCRIPPLPPADVRALVARLQRDVFERFAAPDLQVYATGYSVLTAEATLEIGATQARSLALGGAALALLLLAVVRGVRRWLLALVANVVTASSVTNLLWLSDAAWNPYSAVLVAALLAVLVDDTVHLLWAVRQAERRGGGPGVDAAVAAVGRSITLSSIALACGFASFALSALPAYRQFAWLAAAAIGLAWVWDLGALPSWLRADTARPRAVRPARDHGPA